MNNAEYTLIAAATLPEDPTFRARHYIGGEWCDSSDGKCFERRSPAHHTLVSVSAEGDHEEAELAVGAARRAFDAGNWPRLSGKERAAVLLKVADLIAANSARIARFEVLESGKPIAQAQAELEIAIDLWRYAAALARTDHGDSHNSLGADMLALVLKEPIGVVSVITPWNFPFLILAQKLPFALAAGCTCVVKPSELTPSSATILCQLLEEAGLPAGVVNLVHGYGEPVGAAISSHPGVDMVSFTGSTAVGKSIARQAAGTLKKVSCELGGKNPQVLCADADLSSAIDAVAFGVYFNAGECCNASSRLLVHADIAREVLDRLVQLSRLVSFGDPLHPDTKVGALISPEHCAKIDGYVQAAIEAGAQLELGGQRIEVPGLAGEFYAPTIISGVQPDSALAQEEVFGPVVAVLTFTSVDEAIELVNSTCYGLSAGIWSADVHNCLQFARRVHAGTVWANTWMDGYPELPFGGFKHSGQGRELGSYGLAEFQELKTVQMRVGATRAPWVVPATSSS